MTTTKYKGNSVYDPTCYQAMRNVIIENAKRNGRSITLSVDRKHKEYTLRFVDEKGRVTYTSSTYEREEEIPVIW